VVEDRLTRFSAEYLQLFWQKLPHAAVARSLRQLSSLFILSGTGGSTLRQIARQYLLHLHRNATVLTL